MKDCPTCNTSRDLSEFNRNRSRHDGVMGECRYCQADRQADYRRRNPDRIREQQRQYRARQKASA